MVNPIKPSPARQSRRPATARNVKNGVPEKLKKQGDFDPFELTKLLALTAIEPTPADDELNAQL